MQTELVIDDDDCYSFSLSKFNVGSVEYVVDFVAFRSSHNVRWKFYFHNMNVGIYQSQR